MYIHVRGHVPTWLCAGLRYVVMYGRAVAMCPHGYVRGYVRALRRAVVMSVCAWLCPMCGYGCSHGYGYVCLCLYVCIHWLCLLCYVMLCYVMSVMYTSPRRNHSVHEYKYFVKPLPSAA